MNLNLPDSENFKWIDKELYCEQTPLSGLAKQYGTPLYVYSKSAIVSAFTAYKEALAPYPHLLCYALKANSNLSIISLLNSLGAGFDIVSSGELARIKAAGCPTDKVIFSGVGKTVEEITDALNSNIKCFNIESPAELDRIINVCKRLGKRARISFRVNPNVDAKTHPYISTGLKKNKFGVSYAQAVSLYEKASQHPNELEIIGIDCHIGSQITETDPFVDACEKLCDLLDQLKQKGIHLRHIDFGGGLGIRYSNEVVPTPKMLVNALRRILKKRGYEKLEMIFEEGRSLVGNSGALLMTVQYLKEGELKNFCIVDTAMNDMIRPTLYQAWMQIVPVRPQKLPGTFCYVVGPVCETGDWLGKDRQLAVSENDILALLSAGAYGMSMASNYNSRPRPAEVLVDGKNVCLIRKRESFEDLYKLELPDKT